MNPRVNYEMTQEDLDTIMDACKPVPMIMLQCGSPSSPQENANRAWERLGRKMGFDAMTVRPGQQASPRFFTAVPTETAEQKALQEKLQAEEKRQLEISRLEDVIEESQKQLAVLKEGAA